MRGLYSGWSGERCFLSFLLIRNGQLSCSWHPAGKTPPTSVPTSSLPVSLSAWLLGVEFDIATMFRCLGVDSWGLTGLDLAPGVTDEGTMEIELGVD